MGVGGAFVFTFDSIIHVIPWHVFFLSFSILPFDSFSRLVVPAAISGSRLGRVCTIVSGKKEIWEGRESRI